MLKNIIKVGHR